MKTEVSKPNSLGEKRRWMRLSEVIAEYPLKESTAFHWRKTGKIKRWKQVSAKMTVYDREELEELFNPNIDVDSSIEEVKIISTTKKRRKRIKIEKEVSSHNEQISASTKKKKLRRRKAKIARSKEFNAPILMPKPRRYKPFTYNKEGLLKGIKS